MEVHVHVHAATRVSSGSGRSSVEVVVSFALYVFLGMRPLLASGKNVQFVFEAGGRWPRKFFLESGHCLLPGKTHERSTNLATHGFLGKRPLLASGKHVRLSGVHYPGSVVGLFV